MSAITYTTPSTGGALATNSDPNSAAPNSMQTIEPPERKAGLDACSAYIVAVDGTSITVQWWGFDATLGVWFKVGSAVDCAAKFAVWCPTIPAGLALLFPQITANTGVTKFGVGFASTYVFPVGG